MRWVEGYTKAAAVVLPRLLQIQILEAGWCLGVSVAAPWLALVAAPGGVAQDGLPGAFVESTSRETLGLLVDGHKHVLATVLACTNKMACGHKKLQAVGMRATPVPSADAEGIGAWAAHRK